MGLLLDMTYRQNLIVTTGVPFIVSIIVQKLIINGLLGILNCYNLLLNFSRLLIELFNVSIICLFEFFFVLY